MALEVGRDTWATLAEADAEAALRPTHPHRAAWATLADDQKEERLRHAGLMISPAVPARLRLPGPDGQALDPATIPARLKTAQAVVALDELDPRRGTPLSRDARLLLEAAGLTKRRTGVRARIV